MAAQVRNTAGAVALTSISSDPDDPRNLIERALAATIAVAPVEAKIRTATREGRLSAATPPGADTEWRIDSAKSAGVITAVEADALRKARELTDRVIRVDDFPPDLGASLLQPDNPVTVRAAAPASETPRRRAIA